MPADVKNGVTSGKANVDKKKRRKSIKADPRNSLSILQEKYELSEEQIKVAQELFKAFDQDGNGKIENHELIKAIQALGVNPTKKQMREFMEKFDLNEDGSIDLEEFIRVLTPHFFEKKTPEQEEQELKRAFGIFDRNGDGFITSDELRTAMTEIGEPLSEDELKQMMDIADLNKDGRIDYSEFVLTLGSQV